jgi:hypothetical protein
MPASRQTSAMDLPPCLASLSMSVGVRSSAIPPDNEQSCT